MDVRAVRNQVLQNSERFFGVVLHKSFQPVGLGDTGVEVASQTLDDCMWADFLHELPLEESECVPSGVQLVQRVQWWDLPTRLHERHAYDHLVLVLATLYQHVSLFGDRNENEWLMKFMVVQYLEKLCVNVSLIPPLRKEVPCVRQVGMNQWVQSLKVLYSQMSQLTHTHNLPLYNLLFKRPSLRSACLKGKFHVHVFLDECLSLQKLLTESVYEDAWTKNTDIKHLHMW